MPIYEYECGWGHRVEKIFTLAERPNSIICRGCINSAGVLITGIGGSRDNGRAYLAWSLPGQLSIGKPTRVFVNNQTGDVFTPAKEYEKAPRGFHEKELKNPIERSKFEKEQQQRVDGRNQFMSHHLNTLKDEATRNRHDDLNAKMNAVQREIDPNTGKQIEFTLSSKDKALVKKAMEKSKKAKAKEKKSNVMLAVNHQNSSNLDEIK